MAPNAKTDLQGFRSGSLVALEPTEERLNREVAWLCRCDCGNEHLVARGNLKRRMVKSCGCMKVGMPTKHGHASDGEPSPTYRSWISMRVRCESPRADEYPRYGGRGIKVCARWRRFENFLEDMGERPEGTSIDRIDNDGDYTPENCRWATQARQNRNKSVSLEITAFGQTRNLADWADDSNFSYSMLRKRIVERGWSPERALTQPRIIGRYAS